MTAGREIRLPYDPQPRQLALHTSRAKLILYGGAAGGGKSHALRWGEAVAWCIQVPGVQVYLFRRTLAELEGTHIQPLKRDLPGELASYNETRKRFEFRNGSAIVCCYCEREADVNRYQSEEMHVLLIDEGSHFTDYMINYLITRSRLGGFAERVPEQYRGLLPRVAIASNPGGPGHNTLRMRFIDPAPAETVFVDKVTKRLAQFIPARMDDNKYIDQGYAETFNGLSPEHARALREGDWDAVVGQALHTLKREVHMLRPFVPPRHWTRFMAIDWGSAAPFAVGWFTVSEGALLEAREGWPQRYLPHGAVILYAEWYGWNGQPNKGLRWDARTVAKEIVAREKARNEPPLDYRIGDSAMWAVTDGPSVADNMRDATSGVVSLRPATKSREGNYNEFLCRLAGSGNYMTNGKEGEHPMFYATSDCTHFWRTVPVLMLDSTNPEKGPGENQEDHCYDFCSYGLRSRPYATTEKDRYLVEMGAEIAAARGLNRDPYATACTHLTSCSPIMRSPVWSAPHSRPAARAAWCG